MKHLLPLFVVSIILLQGCSPTTTSSLTKAAAYNNMYEEKPLTVLLMPPINRSTNVEAKEFFHTSLNVPIANAGYYVIPPFLSMEILKKESAYDAEMFIDSSLEQFDDVFGADMALFTIIHKWDKSPIGGKVFVKVEYIFKSTKTNETLYSRTGEIVYDTSVSSGTGGLAGLIGDMVGTAINTAATRYIDVAKACNRYTFSDLPAGKYSSAYGNDKEQYSGLKDFSVTLK